MIKLNFETLTPLHISNGNQLAYNLEYIVINNTVAKLNPIKASESIASKGIFDFKKNYGFREIIKIIEQNKQILNNCYDYKMYAEQSFINYLKGENRDGQKIIQEFINSNGNFYIPGSSIKGMLSTILNRNPELNPLGINPKNPNYLDKFVITDSNYLDENDFRVDIANRPPSINLMTLDPGVEFESTIRKVGNLSILDLKNSLRIYSLAQMGKAKKFVEKFKNLERNPGGATFYYSVLEKMTDEISLDKNEYLVNLGFGGGSYYKIFPDAQIPTFKSKKRSNSREMEEAHTTFTVQIENELFQLGWCKLIIEEE